MGGRMNETQKTLIAETLRRFKELDAERAALENYLNTVTQEQSEPEQAEAEAQPTTPPALTPAEAGKVLGLSTGRVGKLCREGRIPFKRNKRGYKMISAKTVEALAKKRKGE